MKKRAFTLILAVILCASTVLTPTSCGGHTFKEEWSKDATHHWHACEDADCTEVSDKAEHTWDEGKETTYATDTENGVMTYTCTVCKQTKTAETTFNGVNVSQYGEAVYDTTLQNLTATITLKSGNQTAQSVLMLNANEYSHVGSSLNDTIVNISGENADMAASLRNEYLFFKDILYKDITYDAANKVYNTSADYTLTVTDIDGNDIIYKSIKMTMSGSRIVTVEAEFELKQDGATVSTGTIELELSEYNTTEVTFVPDDSDDADDPLDPGTGGSDTITGEGGDGDEDDEGGNTGGGDGGDGDGDGDGDTITGEGGDGDDPYENEPNA